MRTNSTRQREIPTIAASQHASSGFTPQEFNRPRQPLAREIRSCRWRTAEKQSSSVELRRRNWVTIHAPPTPGGDQIPARVVRTRTALNKFAPGRPRTSATMQQTSVEHTSNQHGTGYDR